MICDPALFLIADDNVASGEFLAAGWRTRATGGAQGIGYQ